MSAPKTAAPKKKTAKKTPKPDLYGDIPKARRHEVGMAMQCIYEARKRLTRSPEKAREWLDLAQDTLDAVLSGVPSSFTTATEKETSR
jgi:hypothetical protein